MNSVRPSYIVRRAGILAATLLLVIGQWTPAQNAEPVNGLTPDVLRRALLGVGGKTEVSEPDSGRETSGQRVQTHGSVPAPRPTTRGTGTVTDTPRTPGAERLANSLIPTSPAPTDSAPVPGADTGTPAPRTRRDEPSREPPAPKPSKGDPKLIKRTIAVSGDGKTHSAGSVETPATPLPAVQPRQSAQPDVDVAGGPDRLGERRVFARPEPGTWEFGVGPTVRFGGSIDFFAKALLRPDGGPFVNGAHTDRGTFLIEGDADDPSSGENVSPQLDLLGWQETDPDGNPLTTSDNNGDETYTRNVTFDQSVMHGAEADFDPAMGFSMEASRSVGKNPLFISNVTVGFSAVKGEAEETVHSNNGISTTALTGILYQQGGSKPPNDYPLTPYAEDDGSLKQGGPNYTMTDELFDMGGTPTTDVTVDLKADSLLFTLSLGLEHDFMLTDWLNLHVGLGPTVNVAYLETTVEQSAKWDAPTNALDGKTVAHFSDDESETKFALLPGVFGSVGLRVQLLNRLALDLDCRYDRIFGAIETDHAQMDFGNNLSLGARLIFDF